MLHRRSTNLWVQLGSKTPCSQSMLSHGSSGVCTATVYALCARGALPHVRIMNSIRVSTSDLEAFLSARRTCRLRKLKGQDPLVGE